MIISFSHNYGITDLEIQASVSTKGDIEYFAQCDKLKYICVGVGDTIEEAIRDWNNKSQSETIWK